MTAASRQTPSISSVLVSCFCDLLTAHGGIRFRGAAHRDSRRPAGPHPPAGVAATDQRAPGAGAGGRHRAREARYRTPTRAPGSYRPAHLRRGRAGAWLRAGVPERRVLPPLRIPIRTPAGAATHNGRRAPGTGVLGHCFRRIRARREARVVRGVVMIAHSRVSQLPPLVPFALGWRKGPRCPCGAMTHPGANPFYCLSVTLPNGYLPDAP